MPVSLPGAPLPVRVSSCTTRALVNAAVLVTVLGAGALAASPPWAWALALAALVLVGLAPGSLPHGIAVVSIGLLGYALGATSSPAWQLALVAVSSLAIAIVTLHAKERGLAAGVAGACLAALGLVLWVLARSSWQLAYAHLVALLTALAAGGAALLAVRPLVATRYRRPIVVVAAVISVLAGARSLFQEPVARPELVPAWRSALASLSASASCDDPGALSALERLRVAGRPGAGLALSGVAVLENADRTALRGLCAKRESASELPPVCDLVVSLGARACAGARAWPEQGAATLAAATHPALLRLRGDLLFGAGELDEGIAAYQQAAQKGDRYAAADLVRGLLDRGRESLARSLAVTLPPHPRIEAWLDTDGEPRVPWGDMLALAPLEPGSRVGMAITGAPGELLSIYDRSLGQWVLSAISRYLDSYAIRMPLPPRGAVPAVVSLWLKDRSGVTIDFVNVAGERLSYACAPNSDQPGYKQRMLPEPTCAGHWAQAELRPGAELAGPLASWTLAGSFAVGKIELAAASAAPEKR